MFSILFHIAPMESIIVIVGFLGVGKTTLLKRLVEEYLANEWQPFVILNDYENAQMDSQQFLQTLNKNQISALSGSCICCSGINELRSEVNNIPTRDRGITFIEANGTSDACTLMEFLGVGVNDQFSPPVQISVVDAKNWQNRGAHNELEANQIQVSSLIVLSHTSDLPPSRIESVKQDIHQLNPTAEVFDWDKVDLMSLPSLTASKNQHEKMEHLKAHWSSCSVDLPDPIDSKTLNRVLDTLPSSILRVKGCTRLDDNEHYTYFEKIPGNPNTIVRPFTGKLVSGPKLLAVGPGSDPEAILNLFN